MKFGNYFYHVKFNDGRIVRRERVSKHIAKAVHDAFAYEMILLDIALIEYGVMNDVA